jgi:hypothetical protein
LAGAEEAALLSQASESGSQNIIESGFAEPQEEVVVNDDEETQAIF